MGQLIGNEQMELEGRAKVLEGQAHQELAKAKARVKGAAEELTGEAKGASETLEGSNVNPVDSMVNMISLARQFDMQIKMLQTADANANKASQILSMNA